jgi:hypothetical protein
MSDREFAELEANLERTLEALKVTKDTNLRRKLLLQMRHLLAEADRFLREVPE